MSFLLIRNEAITSTAENNTIQVSGMVYMSMSRILQHTDD